MSHIGFRKNVKRCDVNVRTKIMKPKFLHNLIQGVDSTICKQRKHHIILNCQSNIASKQASVIKNVKIDSKGFWGYVREKTKSKTTVSDLKDPNGHIIRCDLEKADLLNTFFASVFVSEPPGKLPVFDVRYQGTPVTSLKTDMEVLTKQLKNLNTSKSMGPDGCHPRLLRETADIVNIPLQKIFDKTFEEGCVPSLWKDANISALYKNKGEKVKPQIIDQ